MGEPLIGTQNTEDGLSEYVVVFSIFANVLPLYFLLSENRTSISCHQLGNLNFSHLMKHHSSFYRRSCQKGCNVQYMIVELPKKDTQHVGILQNVCRQFENSENNNSVIEAEEGTLLQFTSIF